MNMKIKDIKPLNQTSHSVRRNQAVIQYGVGAMIDFPSQVLMTALPEEWKNPELIHDERLEKLLGVKYFISPSRNAGIPFVRFPRWYFCPKCRNFKPIEKWQKEHYKKLQRMGRSDDTYMLNKLRCPDDNQELVPARIVTVCEHGHIDDFPWVNWVHRQNVLGGEKDICANPQLLFKTGTSATSGLEGVVIECQTCKARANLFGAFNVDVFEKIEKSSKFHTQFLCRGNHPWKHEKENCDKYPCAKQRGASSVYFPRVISSLVIPPYSSYLTAKVDRSPVFKTILDVIKDRVKDCETPLLEAQLIHQKIDEYASQLAEDIYEDTAAVKAVLKRKLLPTSKILQDSDMELQYKAEEYKALTGKITSENFERDEFRREEIETNLYDIKGLKSIALIHKVKEVTALLGFSRIQPTHGMDSSDDRFVSIKREKTEYYPATISKGEGIFLEFNKSELYKFFSNKKFKNRADLLNTKYNQSFYGKNNQRKIDSEFLFIHTLAHLLIKELSIYCGYPTASIRERIYYGKTESEDMCGLLIYTTGGDSEGTLGGLVRQGYPDCLPRILKESLKRANFCANDPVCSFSGGQGIEGLNYAACHSCVLLPETCCEFSNILLDRTVLIGNMDRTIKGFFGDAIN